MTLQVFISKLLSQISLSCTLHMHYILPERPVFFQLLNMSSNYIIIFILLTILSSILSSIISFPVHRGLAADRDGDRFDHHCISGAHCELDTINTDSFGTVNA